MPKSYQFWTKRPRMAIIRSLKRAIVALCILFALDIATNAYFHEQSRIDRQHLNTVQETGLKLRQSRGNIQRAVLHSLKAKGMLTDEDLKIIADNFDAAQYEESFSNK